MIEPKIPSNEAERLADLNALQILDSDPESAFDGLTRLAAEILGVPIALISLIDKDRQWFKSRYGLDAPETPRAISFCGHAVHDNETFIVPDASRDVRFADNPLVADDPSIRFYAGALIKSPQGNNLGTLCAIDQMPHDFTETQINQLELLAEQASKLFALRRIELEIAGIIEIQDIANDEALPAPQRLEMMLDASRNLFQMEFGAIGRIHDGRISLDQFSGNGHAEIGATFDISDSFCGETLESGRVVAIADTSHGKLAGSWLPEVSAGTYLGAPLIVDDRICGTIHFGRRAGRQAGYSKHELLALETVANTFSALLRESSEINALETEISAFFDVALEMLAIADFDGYFTKLNPLWSKVLGYTETELLARPFIEFVHPDDIEATVAAAAGLAEGEEVVNFTNRYRAKDGNWIWLSWAAASNLETNCIYAAARNITDEVELLDEQQRFVNILDASPDFVAIADAEGLPVYMNKAAKQLTAEIGESGLPEHITACFPEWMSTELNQNIDSCIRENTLWKGETFIRGADSRDIPVLLVIQPYIAGATQEAFVSILATDISDIKAGQRAIEEKNAELNTINQELNQFAYVVSHDLKAPLRAIGSLADWIQEDAADALPDDSKEHFHILRSRVDRMEALINGILEYSRLGRQRMEIQDVDTHALVVEIIDSLAPPESMTISVDPAMPHIQGDKTQIGQIFSNLIGNAIKYHNDPAGHVWIGANELAFAWEFSVRDDGPGIEPAFHDKIFQIFQTLERRDKFESTGIGLSIVKKTIDLAGGEIRVDSDGHNGTAFFFTWPKPKSQPLGAA